MPRSPERANPPAEPDPRAPTTAADDAWRRAVAELIERVQAWRAGERGLLRAAVPIPQGDPLAWLEANPLAPRCYWQDRDGGRQIAGLGAAWRMRADGAAAYRSLLEGAQRLAGEAGVPVLSAFAFDGRSGEAEEWAGFPAALALLPAVALETAAEGQQLAAHLHARDEAELRRQRSGLLGLLRALRPAEAAEAAEPPRIVARQETPGRAEHRARINALLDDIEQGRIQKAVPARRVALQLDRPLPAFATLRRWSALAGGSYTFAIEHAGRIFMGCSPERLFRRSGRRVETESLAGTVRRGEGPAADAELAASLREDPKLVREHGWVTRYIRSELEPWATEVEAPAEAGVLKLDRIQHLQLPIRAVLRPGVGDAELLEALHPTPAVCGFPRQPAQALIARREGFQRGWYSGVVGLLTGDGAELAVAIRSALVGAEQAWCYSGAGVVQGSEPEAEWQELEAKIETFLAAVHG